MKKLLKMIFPVFLAFITLGCESTDDLCCFAERIAGESIEGSWLLYETGYSPGAGYIVEPVSAVPPNVLMLESDGTLSSNIDGLKKFRFYLVLDNPNDPDHKILSLYTSDPGDEPQDISNLAHSYVITREESNLRLGFRYCIEGCHLAFKAITLEK